MIIVDSSALLAVFFNEPEQVQFQAIIDNEERCIMSAVNVHETVCVLRGKRGKAAVTQFWQWLEDNSIEIFPFDDMQVRAAAAAFDRYGKGIDSNAKLNMSDCAAYALAKAMDAPLLFKGNDFPETDITPANRIAMRG